MRQLTVILTVFTVAAVQTHAGILDWLRGSPGKGSSADPVASFERGVGRLQERRNRIFDTSEKIDITYDVKRTDSLIEPVVGIVSIVKKSPLVWSYYDLRLAFREGSWVMTSFTFRLPDIDPIHELPDSDRWKAIQACFVSDEAAEAAVEATHSPQPQPDQQSKSANKAAAAAAVATEASPGLFSPTLSDSRATETAAPLQVEKEPQPPPGYITLNRDVEMGHGTNKFVIPKGSQLQVVSRAERVLGVRLQGRLEIIPKSAATEPK